MKTIVESYSNLLDVSKSIAVRNHSRTEHVIVASVFVSSTNDIRRCVSFVCLDVEVSSPNEYDRWTNLSTLTPAIYH
jgi:hypothetical protein